MFTQKRLALFAMILAVSVASVRPGGSISVAAQSGPEESSATVAYVTLHSTNQLILVDVLQAKMTGSIDMTAYGCYKPDRARLSLDGSELYVFCFASAKFIVFETVSNSYVTTIEIPNLTGDSQGDIVFTQDGAYAIASTSGKSEVYVIDLASHEIVLSIPTVSPSSLAAHPYLPRVYVAGSTCCYSGFVQVIDTNLFTVTATIPLGSLAWDVQPSPDGRWLYASDYVGQSGIYKIDAQTNVVVDHIAGLGELFNIQVAPDGSKLFVAGGWSGNVYVIDPVSFTYLTAIGVGGLVFETELTCDGAELFVGNQSNPFPVIRVQDNGIVHQISVPSDGDPRGIAVCPPLHGDAYSEVTVDRSRASSGDLLNYTITINNSGDDDLDEVVITDTLPYSLIYSNGSLSATNGNYGFQNGVISWTGSISTSSMMSITFGARVASYAPVGTPITNTAEFAVEGMTYHRSAKIEVVPHQLFLPCVTRPCLPLFADDFSNPASGWWTENTDVYSMGYVNGEYQILIKQEGWMVYDWWSLGVSDYRVEVDARPAGHLDGGVGLIFGRSTAGYYLFEINDGWYTLLRRNTGPQTWTTLISWTPSATIRGGSQTNHLKVTRIGASITLYANGHALTTINDSTYTGYGLGVASDAYSGNFDGRFDNFVVYTGPCIGTPTTAVQPDQKAVSDVVGMEFGAGAPPP